VAAIDEQLSEKYEILATAAFLRRRRQPLAISGPR
jgi:hypothetical protein